MASNNSKEQALFMDQDRGKTWVQIVDNIEDLSIGSFWYHSKRHQENPLGYVLFTFPHVRGALWLCCVHICQLMTHSAVFTLPFSLQLCYKPLGILQRVTKSQKVHFSSHDGLQDFIISTLVNIGPRVSQSGDRVEGICASLTII